MKIICQYLPGGPSFTLPETAVGREGQPFFVPDDLGMIVATPVLVVPIMRLGKHIAQQFAHRYYTHWSAGVLFVCQERLDELRRERHPWADAFAFDGALRVGKWMDMDEQAATLPHHLCLQFANSNPLEIDVPALRDVVDAMIQRESKWNTLRQGDYLIFQPVESGLTIWPDELLQFHLDNEEILRVKLK